MGTKNQDTALDVIGEKLRLKEEIDAPFDEMTLTKPIKISKTKDQQPPRTLSYNLQSIDAGFNCLCELNLGKAYRYTCQKDEEGNIVSEKRAYYPKSYKCAMNEKWLDYILKQIEDAKNPMVVVSDIFSRVTTGNVEDTLPYKEQLRYIYQKLNKPGIKSKIVALVRGEKELEIMKYSGIDLMGKLAKMLDLEHLLVDAGIHIAVDLEDSPRSISMLHYNKKVNSVRALGLNMQKYADENPGHDIYFCTNAKMNWQSSGVTTYTDEKGNVFTKPCWFVAFGPMYEYDKFNEKRPELGSYTLNKMWYKVLFMNNAVRADSIDYTYPHSSKIDSSSYVASVLATEFEEGYKKLIGTLTPKFQTEINQISGKIRKATTKVIHSKKPKEVSGGNKEL